MTPGPTTRQTLHGRRARMTWASRSMTRSIHATGSFLRRRVWIWPIVAVVLLSALGVMLRGAIERTMMASLRSELRVLLDVEIAHLQTWMAGQELNAESLANDSQTRRLVASILAGPSAGAPDTGAPDAAGGLVEALAPSMTAHDYDAFFVVDKRKRIVASSEPEAIGRTEFAQNDSFDDLFTRALGGEPTVSRPLPSVLPVKDHLGVTRTGTPVMFAAAPIRDENLQVVAALAVRMRPDREFTRILRLGCMGQTGETYAFDRDGLMLSGSRFDEELMLLGILPDEPGSRSILRLMVREPGGDMTRGYRPKIHRHEMPTTRMVAAATTTGDGVDVDGYRDYRGVRVVGAWTWLEKYGFGVATEMDAAEAYRPLTILQRTFWGLFALLALSSLAIFLVTLQVSRLQREAQRAAIEAQQLGQYKLEHKLGSGGMGVVYKAQHALLRRPTAVKMLEPGKVTEQALAAFEREVQVTSQLCHPNTVAIYDYGRTPEGLFYYAMEFLDGVDLQALVDRYGPLPPARVVHVLLQVCGSLYEAHTAGLVHRDIKPSNIMLNRRGAEPDVVKVLDFGLVKAVEERASATGLAGTPLYMSPEAIQMPESVDARSDLYAVGAVGYFLLTGRPVFEADSISELCRRHVDDTPRAPSIVLGRETPAELEDALLACLDKSRAKRPQTARELAQRLGRVPGPAWDVDAAELWWNQHERGLSPGPGARAEMPETRRDQDATIAH